MPQIQTLGCAILLNKSFFIVALSLLPYLDCGGLWSYDDIDTHFHQGFARATTSSSPLSAAGINSGENQKIFIHSISGFYDGAHLAEYSSRGRTSSILCGTLAGKTVSGRSVDRGRSRSD